MQREPNYLLRTRNLKLQWGIAQRKRSFYPPRLPSRKNPFPPAAHAPLSESCDDSRVGLSRSASILGLLAAACGGRSTDSAPTSTGGSAGTLAGGSAGDSSGGSNRGGASGSSAGGASGSLAGSGGASVGAGGFAGATGGSGGDAGASGAMSGSAGVGGQPEPTLTPCNSSDGTGCAAGEVCTVIQSNLCIPSLHPDCVGYCAPTLPASTCEGGLAKCGTNTLCDKPSPGPCPLGQRRSFVNDCYGPCVPADCCACEVEEDCHPSEDLTCDRQTDRCVVPAAPAPRCFLPINTGPCEPPPIYRIAFINGACQETVTCGDIEPLFFTLAECLRHCEGLPQQGACPEGHVAAELCLACGVVGGCASSGTVCAESCVTNDDCESGSCHESVCQMRCF
jgi:hypothetical protein